MCNKAKVGYMSLITNSMQISLNNRHIPSPLEFMLGWYPFFILPLKCIKMWPCKICNEQFELHYLLVDIQRIIAAILIHLLLWVLFSNTDYSPKKLCSVFAFKIPDT